MHGFKFGGVRILYYFSKIVIMAIFRLSFEMNIMWKYDSGACIDHEKHNMQGKMN